MFSGGLIAVDQASNYVYVYCLKNRTSHETLDAKEDLENTVETMV